jgi:hypothetical protein
MDLAALDERRPALKKTIIAQTEQNQLATTTYEVDLMRVAPDL